MPKTDSITGPDTRIKMDLRIQLLQATPFFGAVSDETIRFLLGCSETQYKTPGQFFFKEHELGDSLFLLEKGNASVYKQWNGKEYILRTANNGDCFGELALIDFSPRSATVRADTDCSAIKISSAALHNLYQYDPEQFLIIQMNIAREVSRRLRESDDRWFRLKRDA